MTLVLDASVTLAWLFTDEGTEATADVLSTVVRSGAVVPSIWRLEVANVAQFAVRRGRIGRPARDEFLACLADLAVSVDDRSSDFAWTDTLALAERFRLTVYDAAYLELAQRRSLPLATLDDDLRRAAGAVSVPLLGV